MKTQPTIKLKFHSLVLFITLFILCLGNASFLEQVSFVYPVDDNLGFLVALSIVAIFVIAILATLFSLIMPTKIALSFLLLVSASSGYFVDSFGVIIDDVMIQSLFETNTDEAFDLFSVTMFIRIFLCFILPSLFLYFIELPQQPLKTTIIQKSKLLLFSVVCIFLMLAIFSSHFTTFFREHKPLRYYLNPIYPVYSFGYFINSHFKSEDLSELATYDFTKKPTNRIKGKLVIVVVGETVRASNFQLNQYQRATTPLLSKRDDIINYSNYSSCGTSTAISVPCMFSFNGKNNFDVSEAKNTENALDILAKANVNVLWRDNNSSSKGVADRVNYQSFKSSETNTVCDTECRDIGMLVGLDTYLTENTGDTVIVLHQMGNHGPAYYKRYPKQFEIFNPACQTNELSQCSQQEIINSYDNAIVYTDFFLNQTIKFLEKHNATYDTTMLYVSDHGESLGENGIYLHGLPYFIAPKNQTHVPMVAWFGTGSNVNRDESNNYSQQALNHDSLSYSLIDLFDISLTNSRSPYPLLFPKKETLLVSESTNHSTEAE
ncbi:phosphoethanolamine transferase [Colwellia psychrerythraea]|uniref:Sulfatase n=1 Tax=Colwellia psychrerythraea TaxID=28229 RepID=A0A099K8I1_COLPS|nr:phosphoethanolamine--lipid A transferase [Colwellia psychrerythraea]KGJ86621.1 sulfatase [Colwellia psychrerythraea]